MALGEAALSAGIPGTASWSPPASEGIGSGEGSSGLSREGDKRYEPGVWTSRGQISTHATAVAQYGWLALSAASSTLDNCH